MKRREYLIATLVAAGAGYVAASELRSKRSSTNASRTATPPSEPYSPDGYGVGGYGD